MKNFKQYCELYLKEDVTDGETTPTLIYENVNDRWEVGVCISDGQAQQVNLGIELKSLPFFEYHQLIDNIFPYTPLRPQGQLCQQYLHNEGRNAC